MQFYFLKRRYSGSYYTSRNSDNKPAVLAFTSRERAQYMKSLITGMEYQPQQIIIEKTNQGFVDKIVHDSLLPVIIFQNDGSSREIKTDVDKVNPHTSRRVVENMYKV